MPKRSLLLACLAATLGGCGPGVGDLYEVRQARLLLDQKSFDDARSLVAADEFPKPELGSYVSIGHANVKVIESIKGGAKVLVKGTDNDGKMGWMLAKDLNDKVR
jgi:hypothetical protein